VAPSGRDAPIGVFDSGIGGLTVLRALTARLPCERFVYLGDTARLPYGTKSAASIARYSAQAARTLVSLGAKCIVVACNTASAVGLHAMRECAAGLPVIGVIEPGADAACAASARGHIAVIATERTVSDGAYQAAIARRLPEARVSARAAPLFVALAEEGVTDGPIAQTVARHYLEPLFAPRENEAPDTLVLGCTHFPLLAPAIGGVLGRSVRIVDSAETTAAAVHAALAAAGMLRSGGLGEARFLATDSLERFVRVGSRFLGHAIAPERVELIDL
jgi:glutamate racemase